jgi:cytochrome c oxidase subunit 3
LILVLAFLALLATLAAWWLAQQGLAAKPWLEEGVPAGLARPRGIGAPPAKLGLAVFLVIVSMLFVMLISSYFMRQGLPDWRPLPMPPILFVTTALLTASSAFLGLAQHSARRGRDEEARLALLAGGAAAIAFVAGQMSAWREMTASGFDVAGNPSHTFFYLLTGVHALHVVGGLVALAWTAMQAGKDIDPARTRAWIDLCGLYWHFLLGVWLVLVALLTGYADGLGALCGRLLS